jgi:tetratricopeptide (TPR) repeat protein
MKFCNADFQPLERLQSLSRRLFHAFLVLTLMAAGFLTGLAEAGAGTTAANFLRIGQGARGAAMGDAQTAVTEDVNAAYWNPAGLSALRYQELSLMHYALIDGVRYQQATYAKPTPTRGTFAVGLNILDYGDIKGYNQDGTPSGGVNAKNTLLFGSWGRRVSDKSPLSAGVSFKYLQSDLAGYKATAPMFDFGALYPIQSGRLHGLRLAASLRNIGPDIQYDQSGSPLPEQFVLGAGLSALGGNLVVDMDAVSPKGQNAYFSTGLEYRVFELLRLRVGYNGISNFVGNGISYGMGLQFTQWNIDYAYVPYGDLGNTNRVSVGIRFGQALQMQVADEQVEQTYQQAQRQLALGKPVEAYSTLTGLLQIAPWYKPAVALKAKIEQQFDEMSASKNKARLAAEIADKFTEAKIAFDRDELVDAKKGFETILLLDPDHVGSKVYLERIQNRYASLAQASFKQGMDYYAAGDYAKAKVAFEKTLTINPDHLDAKAQLQKTDDLLVDSSRRQLEMERLAGAAEAYKTGLALYQKNDLEGALVKFQEVQAKVPEYEEVGRYLNLTKSTLASILFDQSQVNFDNGQLSDAVKKLKRAIELNPSDARLSPALEVAQRDLGIKNAEESKALYKDGLQSYLSGQTQKAEQTWRKALELDSTNEDALQALSKIEEQKKYVNPDGGK